MQLLVFYYCYCDMKNELESATFGAGCFWCVEAVFQRLLGVHKVTSGYMGGHMTDPSYKDICTGQTGHAEVAKIDFDPQVISFDELLEVFWSTHDPTTLDRQGADKGTQYRSAIFYHSDQQKTIAEKSIVEVAASLWDEPIVTEVTEATIFYPAGVDHQEYYNQNSEASYCQIVINPKLAKLKSKFSHKLKP